MHTQADPSSTDRQARATALEVGYLRPMLDQMVQRGNSYLRMIDAVSGDDESGGTTPDGKSVTKRRGS